MTRRIATALALLLAAASSGVAQQPAAQTATGPDAAPWQLAFKTRPPSFEVAKRSLYLPMKDGVRLAADVYQPKNGGARTPTLLVQTRYYRKTALKSDPQASCAAIHSLARYFTTRGYALVIVDVRGTGASFGTRDAEVGKQEIADGGTILDWIVAQPWSDGRVGTFGQSYLGTAAEMATTLHHPALKAIAPVSSVFDAFADLYRPGGMLNITFQAGWGAMNRALDAGRPDQVAALAAAAGPCPVDGDVGGAMMAQAIAEHAGNFDSTGAAAQATFRDDPGFARGFPAPYEHSRDVDRVATLSIEATQDSAYGRSGINRLLNNRSGSQWLILAAGDHGAHHFYAPGVTAPVDSAFDQNAEILAFMDRYVAGIANGYDRQPRVRWFVTGANQWRSAPRWPSPSRTPIFHLGSDGTLSSVAGSAGRTASAPLADANDDAHGRWNTALGTGAVFHADQGAADRDRLTFTTAPLDAPIELQGSPVLTLTVSDSAAEGDWIVYLEEIDPAGHAWRVTEGQLRLSARRGAPPYRTIAPMPSGLRRDAAADAPGDMIRFPIGLLPVAHRFAAGSRLRLAFVGSDRAHFDTLAPSDRRVSIATGARGSTLALPLAAR